jgi:hypothetical protein
VIAAFILLRLKPAMRTRFDFIFLVFEILWKENEWKMSTNSIKRRRKQSREENVWNREEKKKAIQKPSQSFHRDLGRRIVDRYSLHDMHFDNGSSIRTDTQDTPTDPHVG